MSAGYSLANLERTTECRGGQTGAIAGLRLGDVSAPRSYRLASCSLENDVNLRDSFRPEIESLNFLWGHANVNFGQTGIRLLFCEGGQFITQVLELLRIEPTLSWHDSSPLRRKVHSWAHEGVCPVAHSVILVHSQATTLVSKNVLTYLRFADRVVCSTDIRSLQARSA